MGSSSTTQVKDPSLDVQERIQTQSLPDGRSPAIQTPAPTDLAQTKRVDSMVRDNLSQSIQAKANLGEPIAPQQVPADQDASHQRIANDITGFFEGGKASSLQTLDSGLISYGKHQATLASGSLYSVLKAYTGLSKSSTAAKIAEYLPRVKAKDASLRGDKVFLQLLRNAAGEAEMSQAQDAVFSEKYWKPATAIAKQSGVNSALGKAIFYDTHIQGGLDSVLKATKARLKGKQYSEQEFLDIFLEERKKRLHNIAGAKRTKAASLPAGGKKTTLLNDAKMLDNSAKNRVGALETLVESGNLGLVGDEKGKINVGSTKIAGLDKTPASQTPSSAAPQMADMGEPEATPQPQAATTETMTVSVTKLNVRQGPGVATAKLGLLSEGDKVTVTGKNGEWLQIQYKGQTAFIHSGYVKPAEKASESDAADQQVADQQVAESAAASSPDLTKLMAKPRLSIAEIKQARELIAQEPDKKKRGDLYLALQGKVEYHSQRDNASKAGGKNIGDVMCNLTSLAMCLSYLGISNPKPEMQFEDVLEQIRVQKKLPARTSADGWGGVAKALGVDVDFLGWTVTQGRDWYFKNVLPRLQQGDSVMLSITGHIVRLQSVTEDGLVVDDPFGRSILKKGKSRGWAEVNKKGNAGKDNAGEDNVWSWKEVAQHQMFWIAAFSK
jgi:Glycosyl hydrolase family 46/Bacterial SH3 domain